ncbi:MAG: glycosyltransferase [Planctomycetota bacterium]|jgi:glycosyltransferase involved in cell wall biosynthesis
MRILFVTSQLGRSYVQGTERYVSSLARCLGDRGHGVTCLAGDPLGLDRRRRLGEPIDQESNLLAYPTSGWMCVMGMPPAPLEVWLREARPDIVHVADPAHVGIGAITACRRLGIPYVVTTMDFWWVCPKSTLVRADGAVCDGTPSWDECIRCVSGDHARAKLGWSLDPPRFLSPLMLGPYALRSVVRGMSLADLPRWMRRRPMLLSCLETADQVIFPSRATHEVFGPRLTHDRWQIVPYGLSRRWFADPGPPLAPATPPEAITIGYAGALLPHKGPHLLLEAVRRLGWTGCRLRLAGPHGDGVYGRRLRRSAAGLTVEFTGALASRDMPAFLRSVDILAVTSLWPENLPFVVLEGQAAGVPIVASDVAGVRDQVPDARALFEPGSVGGLATALAHVREHPSACGPSKVSTIDEMTDATEDAYGKAIAHRRAG